MMMSETNVSSCTESDDEYAAAVMVLFSCAGPACSCASELKTMLVVLLQGVRVGIASAISWD